MDKGNIIVVEDDQRTADLIALYLEREGFSIFRAHDGKTGLAMARIHAPLLVVLDLMLPGLDGWEVCRALRRTSDVPIIMLTARGDETDRIAGLTLGADDYVVKPFSPRELVARVKAVLRRSAPAGPRAPKILRAGPFELDPFRHQVKRDGHVLELTPHEYALLEKMMTTPGRAFSREELIDALYPQGEAAVVDRVVDVHVGKLRQKIETDASHPQYILTVRGVGYRFREENI